MTSVFQWAGACHHAAWIVVIALTPMALLAEQNVAVSAVNQLGLSCERLTSGNSLISPWSLQQSLGMSYAGALGETRKAMGKALGYPDDGAKFFESFRVLGEDLRKAEGGDAQKSGVKSANRLFVSEKLTLKEDWRKLTLRSFSAEAQSLDFSKSESVEKTINDWVNAQTGGKIPTVIPAGGIDPQALLVLVNALSFEMPWEELFTKELTKERAFFVAPAKSKTLPLMLKQRQMRYAQHKGFQIAALPYAGRAFQFVVILPDAVDGLPAMEALLTPQLLAACAALPMAEVRLSIPRIKMAPPAVPMKPLLTKLRMGVAFGARADFGGMTETPLNIDEVFHRAFIEMDEDGTKAAAATATINVYRNGHPHEVPHKTVTADHPFVFLIQDVRSGACLFIGRVTDPAPDLPVNAATPASKK